MQKLLNRKVARIWFGFSSIPTLHFVAIWSSSSGAISNNYIFYLILNASKKETRKFSFCDQFGGKCSTSDYGRSEVKCANTFERFRWRHYLPKRVKPELESENKTKKNWSANELNETPTDIVA